jgi:hypothetical protein
MQAHGRGFDREVEIVAFRRRAQAAASRLKPAGSRRGAALGVITQPPADCGSPACLSLVCVNDRLAQRSH